MSEEMKVLVCYYCGSNKISLYGNSYVCRNKNCTDYNSFVFTKLIDEKYLNKNGLLNNAYRIKELGGD